MQERLVYLVDDDEAIRHSASFMLRHAGLTVKTFPDGVAFLSEADRSRPACVLMDVRMPEMDGLAVLERLRDEGSSLPVIVLTGHGDVSTAVIAMKNGATDFLEKPYEKSALLAAIDQAFQRIERGAENAVEEDRAQAKIGVLTARERDVLERLVEGLTNKGIAEDLDISPRTVEIHRANMMAKLEADSLSAALKIAFAAGVADSSAR